MKLEVGDIILVKGKSEISEEICEVEGSIYSHAALLVKTNVIVEAGWQKVRFNALDSYNGQADIYRCNLDNFQKAQICDYATKQIGKKYDYPLLVWELIRYKLHTTKIPWFKNTDSVICSELISDSFRSIGIDLCPGIKYPSPADLSLSKSLTLIQSI